MNQAKNAEKNQPRASQIDKIDATHVQMSKFGTL
jgi:hypothetical protein